MLPLYVALFEVAVLDVIRIVPGDLGVFFWTSHYLVDLALPILALHLFLLARGRSSEQSERVKGNPRLLGMAIVAPAATAGVGIATTLMGPQARGLSMLNAFEGVWEIVLPLVVAYVVLRYQLFGLDVKLRFAIKNSTVAGSCGFLFLVVSELLEMLIPLDGAAIGVASASAIALLLNPIQHVAERTAATLLPGVKPMGKLESNEQRSLYHEQVRIALVDGEFTEKDRRMLEVARKRLGLRPDEAQAIEHQVIAEEGDEAEELADHAPPPVPA